MNGSLRDDNSRRTQIAEHDGDEELERALRRSSQDGKVIVGAHKGVFDLNRAQIENFFHIVDQRVREQITPSSFTCEFACYYSDGSSRKFPSAASFNEYAETRNRFPTVVTVHLVYLISFPEAEAPEKQEIDLILRASGSLSENLDMIQSDARVRMSGDKIQLMTTHDDSDLGVITYSINHTRYSWGLDIEGHIRGQIEALMTPRSRGDVFLDKISGPLNLFTTVFVGLFIVNLIIDVFFWFLFSTDGVGTPEQMLDAAANYLVNGHIAKYIVATLVVSVVVFVVFSALVSNFTKAMRQPRPSFIILSESDERRKAERLHKFNRRWTKLIAMVVLDIAVALAVFAMEGRLSDLFK